MEYVKGGFEFMNFDRIEFLKMGGFMPARVLDIGAHQGTVAKQMKALWPTADVLMVEANPHLEDTLKSVGLPYKICLLGNENKTVTYYLTKKWLLSSGNSIYKEMTADYSDEFIETMQLPMLKLDDVLKGESFDLIKIDTQGSEIDILNGGLNVLKGAKYLIIECSLIEYNKGGNKIHDIFRFMTEHGLFMKDIIDLAYNEDKLIQIDLLFEKI
jgi:FkbM family methyltransferase